MFKKIFTLFTKKKTGLDAISADKLADNIAMNEMDEQKFYKELTEKNQKRKDLLVKYEDERKKEGFKKTLGAMSTHYARQIDKVDDEIKELLDFTEDSYRDSKALKRIKFIKLRGEFQKQRASGVYAEIDMNNIVGHIREKAVDIQSHIDKSDAIIAEADRIKEMNRMNHTTNANHHALDEEIGHVPNAHPTDIETIQSESTKERDNRAMVAQARKEASEIDSYLNKNKTLLERKSKQDLS